MPSTTERASRVTEARDLLEQAHDLLGIHCSEPETVVSSIARRLVEHLDEPDLALLYGAWDLLIREDNMPDLAIHRKLMHDLALVVDLVTYEICDEGGSLESATNLLDRFAELTTSVDALTARARLVRALS